MYIMTEEEKNIKLALRALSDYYNGVSEHPEIIEEILEKYI